MGREKLGLTPAIKKKLQQLKQTLKSSYDIEALYVFGSYAKKKARDYSDIDVALLFKKELTNEWDVGIECGVIASDIDLRFEVHTFTPYYFSNPYDTLVAEVKKDGIRI